MEALSLKVNASSMKVNNQCHNQMNKKEMEELLKKALELQNEEGT